MTPYVTLSGMPMVGQACVSAFLSGYQLSCRDTGSLGTCRLPIMPPVEGTCQEVAGNPLDSDFSPLAAPAVSSGALQSCSIACGLLHAQNCVEHQELIQEI